MTYLLLILLIGFPVYIYLLWKYHIKPLEGAPVSADSEGSGKKRASSKDGINTDDTSPRLLAKINFRNSFNKMYLTFLLVITSISILSASLIIKAKFGDTGNDHFLSTLLDSKKSNKIAVLRFENNTMDSKLDVVGKMAVDWIMHGITQNKVGQVISPRIIEEYTDVLKASIVPSGDNGILKDYLKPSKVINGRYYLNDGKLLLQCSILDEYMTATLVSFEPVDCNPDNPLNCIEALKQKILGYLITEGDKSYTFEETPPKYEAYQLLLEARTKYTPNDVEYIELLNKAIESDPDFYVAKIDRLEYYYNRDEFAIADSLFTILSKESSKNKRQVNMLHWYEALLKGDNRNAYKYFKNEYNIEPFDLRNNSTAMVLALQYVNRPEIVDTIYNALSMEDMDLDKCRFCEFRMYVKALADIELGTPEKVVDMFSSFAEEPGFEWIKEALISAYVDLNQEQKTRQVLASIQLTQPRERWHSLVLFTIREFLAEGNDQVAKKYLHELIESLLMNDSTLSQKEREILYMAYYFNEDYEKASNILKKWAPEDLGPEEYTFLAISALKTGREAESRDYLNKLEALRGPYQYGNIDYGLAQFYAMSNEPEKAISFLMKSVAEGKRFIPLTFQHDIHLKPLYDIASFQKVMNFWR